MCVVCYEAQDLCGIAGKSLPKKVQKLSGLSMLECPDIAGTVYSGNATQRTSVENLELKWAMIWKT